MNVPPDRGEEEYYYQLPPLPPEGAGGGAEHHHHQRRRLDHQMAIPAPQEAGLLQSEPRSDNNAIYPPGWMGQQPQQQQYYQHHPMLALPPQRAVAFSFQQGPSLEGLGAVDASHAYGEAVVKPAEQKRWKKPPGFPKRPLSAYNLFFRDQREKMLKEVIGEDARQFQVTDQSRRKHRRTHGKIGFQEMAQKVASDWRTLSEEERKPYLDEAKREKDKYQEALKKFRENQSEDPADAQQQQQQQQQQPSSLHYEGSTVQQFPLESEGFSANLPARGMSAYPTAFQQQHHQQQHFRGSSTVRGGGFGEQQRDYSDLSFVRAETAQMLASFGNYQQHSYPTMSERLRAGTLPQSLRTFSLSHHSTPPPSSNMSRRSTFPTDTGLPFSAASASSSSTMPQTTTATGYSSTSTMLDNYSLRASYPPPSSQRMLSYSQHHQETLQQQQQYDDYSSFLASEQQASALGISSPFGGGGATRDFSSTSSSTHFNPARRLSSSPSTSASSWRPNTSSQLDDLLYRQQSDRHLPFASTTSPGSRATTMGSSTSYQGTLASNRTAGVAGSYMGSYHQQQQHQYRQQMLRQQRELEPMMLRQQQQQQQGRHMYGTMYQQEQEEDRESLFASALRGTAGTSRGGISSSSRTATTTTTTTTHTATSTSTSDYHNNTPGQQAARRMTTTRRRSLEGSSSQQTTPARKNATARTAASREARGTGDTPSSHGAVSGNDDQGGGDRRGGREQEESWEDVMPPPPPEVPRRTRTAQSSPSSSSLSPQRRQRMENAFGERLGVVGGEHPELESARGQFSSVHQDQRQATSSPRTRRRSSTPAPSHPRHGFHYDDSVGSAQEYGGVSGGGDGGGVASGNDTDES